MNFMLTLGEEWGRSAAYFILENRSPSMNSWINPLEILAERRAKAERLIADEEAAKRAAEEAEAAKRATAERARQRELSWEDAIREQVQAMMERLPHRVAYDLYVERLADRAIDAVLDEILLAENVVEIAAQADRDIQRENYEKFVLAEQAKRDLVARTEAEARERAEQSAAAMAKVKAMKDGRAKRAQGIDR